MYIPTTSNSNIGGNLSFGLYPPSNQSYMNQFSLPRRGYLTSIDTPNSCIQGGMNNGGIYTDYISGYKDNNRFRY